MYIAQQDYTKSYLVSKILRVLFLLNEICFTSMEKSMIKCHILNAIYYNNYITLHINLSMIQCLLLDVCIIFAEKYCITYTNNIILVCGKTMLTVTVRRFSGD